MARAAASPVRLGPGGGPDDSPLARHGPRPDRLGADRSSRRGPAAGPAAVRAGCRGAAFLGTAPCLPHPGPGPGRGRQPGGPVVRPLGGRIRPLAGPGRLARPRPGVADRRPANQRHTSRIRRLRSLDAGTGGLRRADFGSGRARHRASCSARERDARRSRRRMQRLRRRNRNRRTLGCATVAGAAGRATGPDRAGTRSQASTGPPRA